MASASTPSVNEPTRASFQSKVKLKPIIKAQISGKLVTSGISDVSYIIPNYFLHAFFGTRTIICNVITTLRNSLHCCSISQVAFCMILIFPDYCHLNSFI